MIIAINGPSGSGKSTIAKLIAKEFNFEYLDTGAMYRMLALKLLNENISYSNDILNNISIKIDNNKFYLDNIDVTDKIRTNEVAIMASDISKIKEVREYMVDLQRKISESKSIVLNGRDIGTVVFPSADVKIYLTASAQIRAQRRFSESKGISYDKIYTDILKRDNQDMNRENSPLKKASDAIEIDSSNYTIDEVSKLISNIIKEKMR